MKKISFLLQILFVIFLFNDCSLSQKIVEPQQIASPENELIVWKQIYYPKLVVDDPLLFYNSSEIVISGNFSNQTFELDGTLHVTDNIKEVTKTVGEITPGKLFDLKKDANGRITEMFVSFSENDATYQFDFKLDLDGSFKLNGNAKLIFEGKEYPVLATIKGDSCKLLFARSIDTNIEKIDEKAEGEDVYKTKTTTIP